jgi:lipoate-protein ligase B
MASPLCEILWLGQIPYREAWALQDELVAARGRDEAPDRLLLLEHPHTYTLGSAGHEEYLLMSAEERERRGVEVLRVDRGGDITYHGPGQLVGYPIVKLSRGELRTDFIAYLRNLEQALIRTLADYGVTAYPIAGLTGVWVDTPRGEEKIAAIGVKITVKAVTKHGFALNLNTDLDYFRGIIPCGIADKGVTSLAAQLGHAVDETEVRQRLAAHFGEIFDFEMVPFPTARLEPTEE